MAPSEARQARARVRAWPLAIALVATVAAACLAALAPDPPEIPLLYALPVLSGALVLVWAESALVSLAGLVLFAVAIGVNDHADMPLTLAVVTLICVAALVIAWRHRHGAGREDRIPSFSAEAGMLGVVASDLAATLDLPQLLGSIAQQLTSSVGALRCTIMLFEGKEARVAATTSAASLGPSGLKADSPLAMAQAQALREPLILSREAPGAQGDAMAAANIVQALVLPLVWHGECLGFAVLDDPGIAVSFSERRISLGMTVAGFAALMVNNARLYERQSHLAMELRERSATMEALLRLGYELRATLDLDQVLRRVAEAVVDSLGYREVGVFLYDEASESFQARVSLGGSDELDAYYLANPIPKWVFDCTLRPEFRMGNAYFRSRRRAPPSDEEQRILLFTELGPRADDEWQTGDSLFVPLLSRDGGTIGTLDVYDPVDRRLPTMESIRIVEVFANQAAIAIENAQQYAALQEQERRLARQLQSQQDLLRVSESMLGSLDEEVVFDSIADKLNVLVEYDTLSISKVDWESGEINTVFAVDDYADELKASPSHIDEGVWGWVVTHDEPIFSNAIHEDPRAVVVPGTPFEPQASIVLPLRVLNKVIGVVSVDRLGGRTFIDEEFEFVKPFANLAAIAIENASLFEQQEQRAQTDALTGLFNHGNFQETLEREIKRSERYGEGFSLLMMDLDRFKQVNDRFGHPRGDQVLRRVALLLQESSRETDYVARYGGEEFVLILPKTPSDDARGLAERIRDRVRAIEVAPDDEFHVSASIGVADFPSCGLDARTVLAAADTALLWAKRRGRNCVLYYRDVREAVVAAPDDVDEDFWRNGLEMMAASVDAKASFRERHGEAVSEMVRQLAAAAGCSLDDQETYAVAARLHDIGKIGISAEIIEKGDRLTSDEVAELQRHVHVGVEIMRNADAPVELHDIVLHHHERWDGSGYPGGLSGDAIPLGSRILAICDAFQAMLSDRPYREAKTLSAARDEIRREAGGQFDPGLAGLFLDSCAASGAALPGESAPESRDAR